MGRIRQLIVDLYFCDMSRFCDGLILADIFETILYRWNRVHWQIQLMPVPDGGWAGFCVSREARLTFQTLPSVDFMALEILTVGTVLDPKSLGEQVVAALDPSLVKFDSTIRGEHLLSKDGER